MIVFSIFFGNEHAKKQNEHMYVCMYHGPYKCMKSLRIYVNYNLFDNTRVRTKMYPEFYHGIIYIANEGRYVRITSIH